MEEINSTIKKRSITKSFWFVHGFNVPYSLAHVQSNHVFRKIAKAYQGTENLLFVRVYWPSESAKKIEEKPPLKYKNTFAPLTPWKYLYVANRSYTCGLTLRAAFAKISPGTDINLISHSHGAAMVAASLINPKAQIDKSHWDDPHNKQLIYAFGSLPKNKNTRVNAFMSAPGMPGITTFSNVDPVDNANHYFYVAHNHNDKILRKGQLGFPIPRCLSSTTLGCNWKREIKGSAEEFKLKNMSDHFISGRSGHQREHDLFCYTSQPGFNSLFSRYLDDCLYRVN